MQRRIDELQQKLPPHKGGTFGKGKDKGKSCKSSQPCKGKGKVKCSESSRPGKGKGNVGKGAGDGVNVVEESSNKAKDGSSVPFQCIDRMSELTDIVCEELVLCEHGLQAKNAASVLWPAFQDQCSSKGKGKTKGKGKCIDSSDSSDSSDCSDCTDLEAELSGKVHLVEFIKKVKCKGKGKGKDKGKCIADIDSDTEL